MWVSALMRMAEPKARPTPQLVIVAEMIRKKVVNVKDPATTPRKSLIACALPSDRCVKTAKIVAYTGKGVSSPVNCGPSH